MRAATPRLYIQTLFQHEVSEIILTLNAGIPLAFLTLCDLALNPPFLGGKMIELGKFCFIKTRFEPNLSCFSK